MSVLTSSNSWRSQRLGTGYSDKIWALSEVPTSAEAAIKTLSAQKAISLMFLFPSFNAQPRLYLYVIDALYALYIDYLAITLAIN